MTTLHVLPNPSGITNSRYRTDAFNIAAHKFITNMMSRGYNVIHYGHESSDVKCENVPIITNDVFAPPKDEGHLFYHDSNKSDYYSERVVPQLQKRIKPKDIVLSFYGTAHKKTTDQLKNVYIVEPSIGYPVETVYANYRAFVSYAWMHYYYGTKNMLMEPGWYDEVIYNAVTPDEFDYTTDKEDYFIFIGRMIKSKGLDLAIQVTEKLGKQLLIVSSGKLSDIGYSKTPSHVKEFGYASAEQRKILLAKAKCLIAPTYYIEPFGNIVAEAGMSGTPVLTTDWGGFAENVNHGVTGFRCKDFNSFLRNAEKIDFISNMKCRSWAVENFSDKVIHDKFNLWFKKILRDDFYYDEKQLVSTHQPVSTVPK